MGYGDGCVVRRPDRCLETLHKEQPVECACAGLQSAPNDFTTLSAEYERRSTANQRARNKNSLEFKFGTLLHSSPNALELRNNQFPFTVE